MKKYRVLRRARGAKLAARQSHRRRVRNGGQRLLGRRKAHVGIEDGGGPDNGMRSPSGSYLIFLPRRGWLLYIKHSAMRQQQSTCSLLTSPGGAEIEPVWRTLRRQEQCEFCFRILGQSPHVRARPACPRASQVLLARSVARASCCVLVVYGAQSLVRPLLVRSTRAVLRKAAQDCFTRTKGNVWRTHLRQPLPWLAKQSERERFASPFLLLTHLLAQAKMNPIRPAPKTYRVGRCLCTSQIRLTSRVYACSVRAAHQLEAVPVRRWIRLVRKKG